MSAILIPGLLKTTDEARKLVKISEDGYKGFTFYLVGLSPETSYSDYRHPTVFINLDKKYLDPIVNDLMPKYIDGAIKEVKSSIEWNKARAMDEEAELEKLIKLKEKYK